MIKYEPVATVVASALASPVPKTANWRRWMHRATVSICHFVAVVVAVAAVAVVHRRNDPSSTVSMRRKRRMDCLVTSWLHRADAQPAIHSIIIQLIIIILTLLHQIFFNQYFNIFFRIY